MRNLFRALALALLAYIPAAILARPHWASVLRAIATEKELKRSRRDIVNGHAMNVLGWITTATIFAASIALAVAWFGFGQKN